MTHKCTQIQYIHMSTNMGEGGFICSIHHRYTSAPTHPHAQVHKQHKETPFALTSLQLQREVNWSTTILSVLLSLIFIRSIFYTNCVA